MVLKCLNGCIIEVKSKTKRTYGYSKEMIDAILNKEWEKKVLATIVRRKGSAPQDVGVKMLINRNGKCVGTIGGGCMEAQIIQKAIFMMSEESNCVQICHISMLADEAEEEGFPELAAKFRLVAGVEKAHEERYNKILKNLEEGKTFNGDAPQGWKCRNCGHVHYGEEAPEVCPTCNHPQAYFERRVENY